MVDRQYRHAAFVVEQAGWVDDQPQNEDGFSEGEFFALGTYPDQAAFDADVEYILFVRSR